MSGSKPQPATFIQPPPPTITQAPAPNIQQNAADLYQAQLQYNPQLTAQSVQLQGQYAPQLAQQQFDVQRQFIPQYRSLYEQQFPTQTQNLEQLGQQVNQRLQSPYSLTPQQQAAQDAIRQRQRDELSRSVRSRANVGGTLYGGNAIEQENRAQADLSNQYATTDIQLQQQMRDQLLRELIAAGQVVYPQVQQPQTPQYGQGVTPSPDALLAAIQQGQIIQSPIYQPGNAGTPGLFGSFVNGYRGVL